MRQFLGDLFLPNARAGPRRQAELVLGLRFVPWGGDVERSRHGKGLRGRVRAQLWRRMRLEREDAGLGAAPVAARGGWEGGKGLGVGG